MILLNFTNKYSLMETKDEITKAAGDSKISMFSNMYNIGNNGEYLSRITLDIDKDVEIKSAYMNLQMIIETPYSARTIALAHIRIDEWDHSSIGKTNSAIFETFKKLEKYREELLWTINRAIKTTGNSISSTAIIIIADPNFDTKEYNITTKLMTVK